MKFWRRMAVLLGVAGLLLGHGCGYTRTQQLPRNIKTIYVETVRNQIPVENVYAYVPGLEMDITNALIQRFQRDGNLRVVPKEEADALLQTILIGLEQEGLRFTSLESVEEFRMFIVVAVRLVDNRTGEVIWEEPNVTGDAEYFVSDVRSLAREEAAQRAVKRLAKNVVDRIVEDW